MTKLYVYLFIGPNARPRALHHFEEEVKLMPTAKVNRSTLTISTGNIDHIFTTEPDTLKGLKITALYVDELASLLYKRRR